MSFQLLRLLSPAGVSHTLKVSTTKVFSGRGLALVLVPVMRRACKASAICFLQTKHAFNKYQQSHGQDDLVIAWLNFKGQEGTA